MADLTRVAVSIRTNMPEKRRLGTGPTGCVAMTTTKTTTKPDKKTTKNAEKNAKKKANKENRFARQAVCALTPVTIEEVPRSR